MNRQEAIKVVRDNWPNGRVLLKSALEVLIPELKESEDEKMIKFISNELACLRATDEKGSDRYKELTNAIAWLEKQDERKKDFNYPKFNFDDVLALQCCIGTVKKIQEDKELYEQLQSLHDRIHDAYWLEKQGEQKPDWSEEDEKMWYSAIEYVQTYPAHRNSVVNWLKSIKERIKGE